jgi:hypothetical protein
MDDFFKHYDRDGNRITSAEFQILHARDPFYFRVAMTRIGEVEVSTVLLPFDVNLFREGPPRIFETMVFGGLLDQHAERYVTELEALTGHEAWVQRVRAHLPDNTPVEHWSRSDG